MSQTLYDKYSGDGSAIYTNPWLLKAEAKKPNEYTNVLQNTMYTTLQDNHQETQDNASWIQMGVTEEGKLQAATEQQVYTIALHETQRRVTERCVYRLHDMSWNHAGQEYHIVLIRLDYVSTDTKYGTSGSQRNWVEYGSV